MISCMTYSSKEQELNILKNEIRDAAAFATEEKWDMGFLDKQSLIEEFLKAHPLLDLACVDITEEPMIKTVEAMRKDYSEMMLMLIADITTSPMEYLKPSISPSSLLIRPTTMEKVKSVISEFVNAYVEKNGTKTQDTFVLETREGKTYIPFQKISYFEAREKKVFVRVEDQEYAVYETIENLLAGLPEQFLRCHRSFIINKNKVEKVVLSQNTIFLQNELMVPVSRSYRTEVKNL